MEQIDLSEIQELLDDILGGTVDFQQLVEQGTSGQSILSWGGILHDFGTIFLQELVMQKRLWVHVLLLAVASAVLPHFAEVFKNRSVSQISFAMIYMILLLILMVSFQNSMGIARDVLLAMRNFMTVLAPAYFLAMTMTSYVASAGVYYEFILLLVSGLQRVLELFVLPCIEIYVLLVMVDHLSGEERLSRLTELLEMVVGWSLKGVVAAVMAFHMIQGLLTPAADAFRKLTVSKGIEMIPGIGDAGSSVTDMIKNGIGAAALVVLLLLCLIPLAKLGIMMAAYYLLAAVLQPISDERITGCLAGVGCGMKLLFQTICMVLVLFLLTVALTTAITGR
jgi:stage III sporulation protein AE